MLLSVIVIPIQTVRGPREAAVLHDAFGCVPEVGLPWNREYLPNDRGKVVPIPWRIPNTNRKISGGHR